MKRQSTVFRYGDRPGWYGRIAGNRKKLRAADQSAAEIELAHIRSRKSLIDMGIVDPEVVAIAEKRKTPLADVVARYMATRNYQAEWLKQVDRLFATMLKMMSAVPSIGELTGEDINAARKQMIARGLSAKYINHHFTNLSAMLTWAVRNRYIRYNPMAGEVRKMDEMKDRRRVSGYLTPEEFSRLMDTETASPLLPLWTLFRVRTGIRLKECGRIRWSMLSMDCERPNIYLPASITKTGQEASLPMALDLADMLALSKPRNMLCQDPFVFEAEPTRATFDNWMERAKIRKMAHQGGQMCSRTRMCLRHTFANWMDQIDVPDKVQDRLMRHAPKSMRDRHYTRPQLSDDWAVIENMVRYAPIVRAEQKKAATA